MPIAVLAIVLVGIVGMIMVMIGADHKTFSVYLKWNPPPSVPGVIVAGYNIYRSTQPGGPFEKIASGVPSPKYTDRHVSSGQTYYYIVRTVDAAGVKVRFPRRFRLRSLSLICPLAILRGPIQSARLQVRGIGHD